MKVTLYALILLVFFGCKSKGNQENGKENHLSDTAISSEATNSRIVITLNGMDYHSPVKCSYFGENYFYFKSDELETTDTNGDGIVINGHQQGDNMILTLMMNEKTYTGANLGLQKREFIALGTGKLFSEDGTESFKTTYKFICQ